MNTIRPGQPTPTPRPGTGPQIIPEETPPSEQKESRAKPKGDEKLHPREISREQMESEMPADPDMDDPVSP